jgi:uncharacterized protein YcbK (DUF882 family)
MSFRVDDGTQDEACPCCATASGRRGFLRGALGLAAVGAACSVPTAEAISAGQPRRLNIYRIQTGETFSGVYWHNGRYDRRALHRLNWVFRDLNLVEATPMDPRLFDVMYSVASMLDSSEYFEVISGYRTEESNDELMRHNRRAARASLHISGMAADCRLTDRDSLGLARVAAEMQQGGVGLYRRDGFVHLDCGHSRRWS